MEDSQVGNRLGEYRVVRLIGEGGMGRVYEGQDLKNDRHVAIKTLSRRSRGREEILKRFKREVVASGRISHPNLVTIYDADIEATPPFLVMEYLEGETLDHLLRRLGRLPFQATISMTLGLLEGLGDLHRADLVHRDLKPSNIFITVNGIPKIMDLGLVKDFKAQEMTQVGGVLGTPRYLSPEALVGGEVSAASDIYQIGVILYECLTGHSPFRGKSVKDKLKRVIKGKFRPLSRYMRGHPAEFENVVQRTFAKDPKDRYSTTVEFIAALTGSVKGMGVDRELRTIEGLEILNQTAQPYTPREPREQEAQIADVVGALAEIKGAEKDARKEKRTRVHRRYKKSALMRAASVSLFAGLILGVGAVSYQRSQRTEGPAIPASLGPDPAAPASAAPVPLEAARLLELGKKVKELPLALETGTPRTPSSTGTGAADPPAGGVPLTAIAAHYQTLAGVARRAYEEDPRGPWKVPGAARQLCQDVLWLRERIPSAYQRMRIVTRPVHGAGQAEEKTLDAGLDELVSALRAGGEGRIEYWKFVSLYTRIARRPRIAGMVTGLVEMVAMGIWLAPTGPVRQEQLDQLADFEESLPPPSREPFVDVPEILPPDYPGRSQFRLDLAGWWALQQRDPGRSERIRSEAQDAWMALYRSIVDSSDQVDEGALRQAAQLGTAWPAPRQAVEMPRPWTKVERAPVHHESMAFTAGLGTPQPGAVVDWAAVMQHASDKGIRLEYVDAEGKGLQATVAELAAKGTDRAALLKMQQTLKGLTEKGVTATTETTGTVVKDDELGMDIELEDGLEEGGERILIRDRDAGLLLALAKVHEAAGDDRAAAAVAGRALHCWFRRASGPPMVDLAWRPRILEYLAKLHLKLSKVPPEAAVRTTTSEVGRVSPAATPAPEPPPGVSREAADPSSGEVFGSSRKLRWSQEGHLIAAHFHAQWGLFLLASQASPAPGEKELAARLDSLAREVRRELDILGIPRPDGTP